MVRIDEAAHHQDKAALIRMGSNLLNDCEEYLAAVYESAGITDEDIERNTVSDEETQLLVQAAASSVGSRLPIVIGAKQEDERTEHDDYCNCEDCCRARGGKEICGTCHCVVGEGCPGHKKDEADFEVNVKS